MKRIHWTYFSVSVWYRCGTSVSILLCVHELHLSKLDSSQIGRGRFSRNFPSNHHWQCFPFHGFICKAVILRLGIRPRSQTLNPPRHTLYLDVLAWIYSSSGRGECLYRHYGTKTLFVHARAFQNNFLRSLTQSKAGLACLGFLCSN